MPPCSPCGASRCCSSAAIRVFRRALSNEPRFDAGNAYFPLLRLVFFAGHQHPSCTAPSRADRKTHTKTPSPLTKPSTIERGLQGLLAPRTSANFVKKRLRSQYAKFCQALSSVTLWPRTRSLSLCPCWARDSGVVVRYPDLRAAGPGFESYLGAPCVACSPCGTPFVGRIAPIRTAPRGLKE